MLGQRLSQPLVGRGVVGTECDRLAQLGLRLAPLIASRVNQPEGGVRLASVLSNASARRAACSASPYAESARIVP